MDEKQKQRGKLLVEIMHADEKDGLYEQIVNNHNLTAVGWLIEQVQNKKLEIVYTDIIHSVQIPLDIIEQAKQMEKKQIIKAWGDGNYAYFYSKETGIDFDNGEQYYNEIYNK